MTKSDKMKLAWAKRKADPNYKSRKWTEEEKQKQKETIKQLWDGRKESGEFEEIHQNMINSQRKRHAEGVGTNISPEKLIERNQKIGEALKGREFTPEWKQKLSNAAQNRVITEETKQKLSEINKGKKIPEERRLRIIESRTGLKFSEEAKKNISESQKGKVLSEETKNKISIGNKGKIYSEETRMKMSESRTAYLIENGVPSHGIFGAREDLGNIEFKSRWEANYARYLNSIGIAWEYEPHKYETPYKWYLPDFLFTSI